MALFENITLGSFVFVLYALEIMIAFAVVFLERKNPPATLAWLMVLFLFPVGGIVLYFLFSQNIARKRIYRLTQNERRHLEEPLQKQIEEVVHGNFGYANKEEAKWKDLILLNQNYAMSFLTQDNRISIMTDGNHMFESLLADIAEAKFSINIEYFIVKKDVTGRKLFDALIEKAREGIEVRLLLDALGSRFNKKHYKVQEFLDAGGRFALFFPPKISFVNFRFNYRNHRKIVVIDDKTGYIGGFNIGDEYLGKKQRFGNWRDTHIRVQGDCINDLNATFCMDWRLSSKEDILIEKIYGKPSNDAGHTSIQIVNSGPNSVREEVRHAYLKMITSAKKNIYIQSPYFIPDNSIFDSLVNAAHSGVDVRIMIPCMPDHIFVYWATYYYCGLLLKSGVKVYVYDNGFLHAKTIAVDGEVCSVGSANFDIRSFRLNFESNAIIFDPNETYQMESIFESDMAESHELTRQLYSQRSLFIKFKEGIAKLLSDIL